MAEENNIKHLDTEEDPVTSFMFGKNRDKRSREKINDYEDGPNEYDRPMISNRERDWLFRARQDTSQKKKHDQGALSFLNNINVGELIENIEVLIDSADQLKPLYKKATPLISQFLKKS
jgi:hypothetical protein